MHLSGVQKNILVYLSEGWVLTAGKVVLGRPGICWLKKLEGGRIKDFQKVSNVTFRSLKAKGLIMQASEDATTITYQMTEKGAKNTDPY